MAARLGFAPALSGALATLGVAALQLAFEGGPELVLGATDDGIAVTREHVLEVELAQTRVQVTPRQEVQVPARRIPARLPVVVQAGGAWTSVTPGSQQYWLQAFNNVLHGRWRKIEAGYGKAVLGYFGRPPLPPDPEVVKTAAEQLGKEPFDGDPLEVAPDSLAEAEAALDDKGIEPSGLSTRHTSLEDVFVHLTGRHLRDN